MPSPGGPAASAGLRGGDRIVPLPGSPGRTVAVGGDIITAALGGRPLTSTDDLIDYVQALRPGDRLEVAYLRGCRSATTVITVASDPGSCWARSSRRAPPSRRSSRRAGG